MTSAIEPLESRIAPASVLTYTDIDGDRVTIASTLGDLTGHASIVGGQLRVLDLSAPSFDGVSITVSVVKAGAGDGLVAIGRINGGTNDFGAIVIKGDLGDIDAGSNTAGTPAIKSLTVRTLGRYGTATQGGAGNLQCDIVGTLGALKVAGDVKDTFIHIIPGTIGPVNVGGSLIGGTTDSAGRIFASGDIGVVKIGRDVQGGSGTKSGSIESNNGKIGGVTLGGSLNGGSGPSSGQIFSGSDMGAVKIGRDIRGGIEESSGVVRSNAGKLVGVTLGGSLIGGSARDSGQIFSNSDMGLLKIGRDVLGGADFESGAVISSGKLAGITLGGSLIGGSGTNTGVIISQGAMGAVTIAGDLKGASIASGSLSGSGFIESAVGRIAKITIGGSIIAGIDNSAGGDLLFNATIRAAHDIGAIAIKGGLLGSVGTGGFVTKAVISARGQEFPTAFSNLAIGKISIGGRVERAQILGGYDVNLAPQNGNAQIGAVTVGSDWVASDLVAGVQDGGAAGFGEGDTIIGGALSQRSPRSRSRASSPELRWRSTGLVSRATPSAASRPTA